jgi:hypothetical protein
MWAWRRGEDLSEVVFKEPLATLREELEGLNAQARELEATIAAKLAGILGGGVKGVRC